MPRRLLTCLLLLAATTACADGPLSPGERTDLRAARARWGRNGGPDYTVEARVSCFCGPHLNVWTRLTVRGGQVVAAVPLQSLPTGTTPSLLGWPTVDEVFRFVAAPGDVVDDVAVRFDARLGYPLYAAFACDPGILDCGTTYEMRSLAIP